MKNVTVVVDGQAGSCGKGKIVGYLAQKNNVDIAIDNFMSNAGHTYVGDDNRVIMVQQLPTSLVNKDTTLIIGPGAAITPSILFKEMLEYLDLLGGRKVIINPRAVVILEKHREQERSEIRSGSTFKGCGYAQSEKCTRKALLFGEWWKKNIIDEEVGEDCNEFASIWTCEELSIIKEHIVVQDTLLILNDKINNGESILIEGSQGCDLDINYGLTYPECTSRQCHAGQLVADCGIAPTLVDDVILIIRPYPIRISNTTRIMQEDGTPLIVSSGDYASSEELSWEDIRLRCGAPKDIEFGELTTVTKLPRRVFEMNWNRLSYVTKLNRPTQIVLNFAQYIDWSVYKCRCAEDLTDKIMEFIKQVEDVTGVKVTLVGTGPCNSDVIEL